jgi:hypothetical protein
MNQILYRSNQSINQSINQLNVIQQEIIALRTIFFKALKKEVGEIFGSFAGNF